MPDDSNANPRNDAASRLDALKAKQAAELDLALEATRREQWQALMAETPNWQTMEALQRVGNLISRNASTRDQANRLRGYLLDPRRLDVRPCYLEACATLHDRATELDDQSLHDHADGLAARALMGHWFDVRESHRLELAQLLAATSPEPEPASEPEPEPGDIDGDEEPVELHHDARDASSARLDDAKLEAALGECDCALCVDSLERRRRRRADRGRYAS